MRLLSQRTGFYEVASAIHDLSLAAQRGRILRIERQRLLI